MTIFMWTLSGLAALTLACYVIIPIARAVKNMGRRRRQEVDRLLREHQG